MTKQSISRPDCFLCSPDEHLVYLRGGDFFAMLGLGPLMEGYSLIATSEHVPSMLDLDAARVEELVEFIARVQAMLAAGGYPPATITEHGRVAACVHRATSLHEPHCLHAHWLLFPGAQAVDLQPVASVVERYASFRETHEQFDWPGQYLYSETPGDCCRVAPAQRPVPRQLMRRLVARSLDMETAADWRTQQRLEIVEAARRRLLR